MKAYVWVFDHPYFAVTDDDGNFEIKKRPGTRWQTAHRRVARERGLPATGD